MKVKIALLLVATVGSAALVAPAQTPKSYVITSDRLGEPQADGVSPAAAPVVVQEVSPGTPYGVRQSARSLFAAPRNQFFAYSTEENGLSNQAEQLAQQLAAAKSDSDREKIKGQLAETLEKQFDQRQKRHEEEIKSLEAQIKKLKDLVDKRQENRREIIGARLNQILKESQGLGW